MNGEGFGADVPIVKGEAAFGWGVKGIAVGGSVAFRCCVAVSWGSAGEGDAVAVSTSCAVMWEVRRSIDDGVIKHFPIDQVTSTACSERRRSREWRAWWW